jgi:hypothetical protein
MKSKKKIKLSIVIFLTSLLIFVFSFQFLNNGSAALIVENEQRWVANAYSTSSIVINDSNIASYSSSGSGAIDDPYIIDNLFINTTDSLAVDFNGVSAGTYYELRDSHLIGSTYGVYIHDITNGEATVVNCTIEAALAIGGGNAKYLTIRNCTLKFTQAPLFRFGLTFQNNEVYYVGSYSGSVMNIEDHDNIVEHNNYYGNYSYFAVRRIVNSSVGYNNLNNAGFFFSTDEIENIVTNDFEGNIINGKPFGYFVNRDNDVIAAETYSQIYIVNSTNTIIEDANIDHLNLGIQVHNCTDVTLRRTHVSGDDGINVEESKGIKIEYSNLETFGDGIELDTVEDITLLKNYVRGAEYGIDGEIVDGLKLFNNTIIESTEFGMYLGEFWDLEMIFNVISCEVKNLGSEIPVYFWDGDNMTIYYNVFISIELLEAEPIIEDSCTNSTWYDETIEVGNHYSDWNGSETYSIPGNSGSKDLYPMIDFDNDTLEEYDEVVIYHTDPFLADSDFDGLDDNEEINTYGTDPNNPDSDNDGYSDFEEVQAGTDPLDPKDHPINYTLVLGLIFGLGIPIGIAILLVVLARKGKIKLPFIKKK